MEKIKQQIEECVCNILSKCDKLTALNECIAKAQERVADGVARMKELGVFTDEEIGEAEDYGLRFIGTVSTNIKNRLSANLRKTFVF